MTVFDASALLALARQEPDALLVARQLGTGHVSAANACEFVQKVNQYGGKGQQAFEKLEDIGLTLHPVERADAYEAAAMYDLALPFGLSLADRLCLALARRLGAWVYTADAAQARAAEGLGMETHLIR